MKDPDEEMPGLRYREMSMELHALSCSHLPETCVCSARCPLVVRDWSPDNIAEISLDQIDVF